MTDVMKWVKKECLECDCFRVDECDECEHCDPITEECSSSNWPRGQCSEEECDLVRLERKLFLAQADAEGLDEKCARQELQLAAYREWIECALWRICSDCVRGEQEDCQGWPTVKRCGKVFNILTTALANPDGSGVVARLRAGERLARLACRLEWHDTIMDPHDGPVGYRCPVCGQDSLRGEHAADCELAAALADLRESGGR